MSDVIITGSISHGTMREEDLIPVFLDALKELSPARAERLRDEYADTLAHLEAFLEPHNVDEVSWLMHDLFDSLDANSPDGYYFGASEGDGSDYGFWEVF